MIKILCIIFLFSFSTAAFSQYNLTIEISPLENNDGQLLCVLMDENENVIREFTESIADNKCLIEVKDLPKGKYGLKYFHDENMNKELDTNWIGIPKEGMGFSNNAKGKFGPPSFEDTIFEVSDNFRVHCKPTYL